MNPETLAELMAAMAAEVRILTDLAALEGKKTAVLVAGNALELDGLVREEQALIWQLGRAEERRQRLHHLLAEQAGIPAGALTLGRLAEAAPAEAAPELQALQAQYLAACAGLTRLNHQNRELIQGALAYVEFALHSLKQAAPPGTVYTAGARRHLPAPGARSVLDGRV